MPDSFDQYTHPRTESNPIIYVYSESFAPGCVKVGYTTKPVEERMRDIHPVGSPTKTWTILYTESALYPDGSQFMDHDVHRELERRGFHRIRDPHTGKLTEFFRCTVSDVKAAIIAVKNHTLNEEDRTATFQMRPEQADAVAKTMKFFAKEKAANPHHSAKYLWNCKMRFGKTFAAYELAKKMGMKRVLILTFKPAVEDSWETDLLTHVDFEGWQFYSRKYGDQHHIEPQDLDQSRPIVCFGSFQDYLGTDESGQIKAKNVWVHTTPWNLVIFDEYHFGAWRDTAKKLFEAEDEESYYNQDIEEYQEKEAGNAYNETWLPITTDHYLFLSGTPFRAINTGEFLEDQIFSWTYSDEQQAKADWPKKHPNEPNPYAALPRMVMMTYKMPDELEKVAKGGEFDEFDLNVFFSAKTEKNASGKPDLDTAEFVYHDYVQKFLDMMRGAYLPMSLDDLHRNKGEKPVLPFSDARMLGILNHTLWFLPNVASCYAMKHLLEERQNQFYHDYTINLCAGSAAGIGLAALKPVRESMDPALETKSITLSCGKLTTGVTIKPWTGILMLRNLSSPETYFQAAFRVQSPWTIKHEDGSEEIVKHDCYVFDFAVNRALREISDYSTQLDIHESNPEKKVGAFIKFLPVLAFDGSAMKAVNAGEILDIVTAGTSASLLARRWQSALLVNVDNDVLSRLLKNQRAMDALMSIEGFRSLNSDIATIINKSAHVKEAKTREGSLTPHEKKELSDEEKEYKSKRRDIQEKLIKFATRIPIFMYLTDYREYSLKDVISKLEPSLFKRVTGLTVDDFELLVSLGLFNDAAMNDAVYKFKRYEDSSLEYTGIKKHEDNEDIGLFSTSITRAEYEALAKEQLGSLSQPSFVQAVGVSQPETQNRPEQAHIRQAEASVPHTAEAASTAPKKAHFNKSSVHVGTAVYHKKFGDGTVVKMSGYSVFVRFTVIGEKQFMFPQAFENGFLSVKQGD